MSHVTGGFLGKNVSLLLEETACGEKKKDSMLMNDEAWLRPIFKRKIIFMLLENIVGKVIV